MLAESILVFSIVLQFAAAVLALRLIRTTKTRLAWSLIAAGLIGMEIRRIMNLVSLHLGTGPEVALNTGYEVIGLLTSACILGGIAAIEPIFTEIAKMQEKMQKSEERYRAIVTGSFEGIYIFDTDAARIVESNPSFQRMTGYTAEELKNKSAFDLIAHDSDEVYRNIEKIKRMGSLGVGERNYRRKDGSIFPVVASASRIDRREGKPLTCVIVRELLEKKGSSRNAESTTGGIESAPGGVKALEGLLPICANCKKIRDDKGDWVGIEIYIRERSGADFTHSICPDCISELYPGL